MQAQNSGPAYLFCLGGQDLEMVTIRDLVTAERGPDALADHRLSWAEATASCYRADITAALARGVTPVLVELRDDLPPELPRDRLIRIDHHGAEAGAGRPTPLQRVAALLQVPPAQWSRWHDLVVANDVGHIAGLRAIGASDVEIEVVRAADRRAQGVTAAEEAAGQAALTGARRDVDDRLSVIHLPHGRMATVTDPMALHCPERALLVLAPGEAGFFGPGAAVAALNAAFPGGWSGGALPETGFWGHSQARDEQALVAVIQGALAAWPRTCARSAPQPGGAIPMAWNRCAASAAPTVRPDGRSR